ncbi:hypothetical protein N7504_001775 [Penicillium tannophilum]|nr:hypothetical protein N7504_001775 [Penicillium tannophilum]
MSGMITSLGTSTPIVTSAASDVRSANAALTGDNEVNIKRRKDRLPGASRDCNITH